MTVTGLEQVSLADVAEVPTGRSSSELGVAYVQLGIAEPETVTVVVLARVTEGVIFWQLPIETVVVTVLC